MELKCGIPVYMYLNNLMNVSLAVVNDFWCFFTEETSFQLDYEYICNFTNACHFLSPIDWQTVLIGGQWGKGQGHQWAGVVIYVIGLSK